MSRRGDMGYCECHRAHGLAVVGSVNVLVNHRPALRHRDVGMHEHGSRKSWTSVEGACCVLVNDRRVTRIGDKIGHVRSAGRLVTGSPNVLVGDYGKDEASTTPARIDVQVKLNDMPLCDVEISTDRGNNAKTNEHGMVQFCDVATGPITIRLGGRDSWRFDVHGGERVRLFARLSLLAGGCAFTKVVLAV